MYVTIQRSAESGFGLYALAKNLRQSESAV
jgi:hypothetical protein